MAFFIRHSVSVGCFSAFGEEFEGVDVDFGDRAAYGVVVFPVAGADFAFYKQSGTFADVLLCEFGGRTPHDDVVPLGDFRQFDSASVGAAGGAPLVCGEGEFGHRAGVDHSHDRILADVAEENYFVHLVRVAKRPFTTAAENPASSMALRPRIVTPPGVHTLSTSASG